MSMLKVYPNPTVESVVFQINFPNLFYLENKIPEFQLAILEKFPESSLIINQNIMVGNKEVKYENSNNDNTQNSIYKIWQFKNKQGYVLSISTNVLSLKSTIHKTYNNDTTELKLKHMIEFCLNEFKKVIKLPYVNRIGLRYVNKCPLPEKTTEKYNQNFNSGISFEKNKIEDINNLHLKILKNKDKFKIIYQEIYNNDNPNTVVLDYDAFINNIKFDECICFTDKLHEIISSEFENSVKQPIFNYMEGNNNV